MELYPYLGYSPQISSGVYISPGVKLIGRAFIGENASIWFNSVVRADVNSIHIGKNTNIQDLCMLHVTEKDALLIGNQVSLGHSVVLHGCKIGDHCLIGMGSIILDGAEIGDHCVVAAGSLVAPGKKFAAGSLIKGRPAIIERALTEDELNQYGNHYKSYLKYKDQYLHS